MSKMTLVRIVDDLNGEEYTPGTTGETVPFSLDGIAYEIDLSAPNAEGLRDALALYIAGARRPSGRRSPVGKASSSGSDTAEARAWLQANGYDVKDKGRIPGKLWEAYREGVKAPAVVTVEAPVLSVVKDQEEPVHVQTDDAGATDGLFDAPESDSDVTPASVTEVTDSMIVDWCNANGKKVELTKEERPNSATRRRYLRAHGLAS